MGDIIKETKILKIDCKQIDRELIKISADILKKGGIVAFPTETVYGLGANALDGEAVAKIFKAKGRPSDNPLIVHIANIKDIKALVKNISRDGQKLMKDFWPGPLTLIFEKSHLIPEEVSPGLTTVAIRMPSHPIAKSLIEEAGIPIAAPSANISGKPSPTKGQHVIGDLDGRVDAIIAGGSCNVGVESTVLDISGEIPLILRPGGVTKEMLEKALGKLVLSVNQEKMDFTKTQVRSPGMKYTHYAPKAKLIVVEGNEEKMIGKIKELKKQYEDQGKIVGIISTDETCKNYARGTIKSMGKRKELESIASNLFKVLREFDESKVEIILAESVEDQGMGQAIMNRLKRAAGDHVIQV